MSGQSGPFWAVLKLLQNPSMKFEWTNKYTIQCMGQNIRLKVKGKPHDLTFSAHTIKCVCQSIRSMFRVLGIYNFELNMESI